MTQKVNPSQFRPAEAFKTAGAIGYAGGTSGGPQAGFVTSTPSEVAQVDPDITESALNSFAQSSSASSLTVTIDPGEAFVGGAWLCTDTSTTVSLQASTTGQTVFVGWDQTATDEVVIGLAGAFASGSSDVDFRIPLFTFDTDGSGVTNVSDERRLDYSIDIEGVAHFGDNEQASIEFDGTDLAVSGADLSISDDLVTDAGETVWDSSSAEVPDSSLGSIENATLSNSSVTVSAGDGLKSGGSVSLGGSVTLDTEPADFAGTFLSDDGSDDLQVDIGRGLENDGTGQIQFDEDTAYTFTSDQTFNSGLRIAKGQPIEDKDGNAKFVFDSSQSVFNFPDGDTAIAPQLDNQLLIRAYPTEPLVVEDREGFFTAFSYSTSPSAPGQLDLSNAELSSDFQLQTGQSIVDGESSDRMQITSVDTKLIDEAGNIALSAFGGNSQLNAYGSGGRIEFRDRLGDFIGFEYQTSSTTPGTLELTNADLVIGGNSIEGFQGSINFADSGNLTISTDEGGTGGGFIFFKDKFNDQDLLRLQEGSAIEVPNRNLRLDTNQSIEDGNNNTRLELLSNGTNLVSESGSNFSIQVKDSQLLLNSFSGAPINVFDQEGGFKAFSYSSSSTAPGTLELTNAVIEAATDGVVGTRGGSALELRPNTTDDSLKIGFIAGSGSQAHIFNRSGELDAKDDAGNITTLT